MINNIGFRKRDSIAKGSYVQGLKKLVLLPLGFFKNNSKAYFSGGYDASTAIAINEIDGYNFQDNSAINPSATLTTAVYSCMSVHSLFKGYWAGGFISGTQQTGFSCFIFSSETSVIVATTLAQGRGRGSGGGNLLMGVIAGGYNTGVGATNRIDGIRFSNESGIDFSAALTQTKSNNTGSASSTVKVYFAGGTAANDNPLSEISGFVFSTQATANPSATLASSGISVFGMNSEFKGYFAYGTEICGIRFSNETSINPSAALSVARAGGADANNNIQGICAGGNTPAKVDEIDGIQFSDESAINPSATLVAKRMSFSGVQSGGYL